MRKCDDRAEDQREAANESPQGALVADGLSGDAFSFVNAFAAGAVLAMIADTMIPEAFRDSGRWAGFITVAGFALSFLLSTA